MNNYMRDMARSRMMMRDGRNPYGSRGGYVMPRRRDRAMGREDYNYYDEEYDRHYEPVELMGRFKGYYGAGEEDYARSGRRMGRDYARGGRDMYGYGYDYAMGDIMDDRELEEWCAKLKLEIEEKDKVFFTKENIRKKADQLAIKFDKFSFEEFMTAVLMMYTDYHKTLGTANMDTYLRLAKDWLCDEDATVKYGEKLSAYYDNIVCPMM